MKLKTLATSLEYTLGRYGGNVWNVWKKSTFVKCESAIDSQALSTRKRSHLQSLIYYCFLHPPSNISHMSDCRPNYGSPEWHRAPPPGWAGDHTAVIAGWQIDNFPSAASVTVTASLRGPGSHSSEDWRQVALLSYHNFTTHDITITICQLEWKLLHYFILWGDLLNLMTCLCERMMWWYRPQHVAMMMRARHHAALCTLM